MLPVFKRFINGVIQHVVFYIKFLSLNVMWVTLRRAVFIYSQLYIIPVNEYTTDYLAIQSLMDIWVISSSELLQCQSQHCTSCHLVTLSVCLCEYISRSLIKEFFVHSALPISPPTSSVWGLLSVSPQLLSVCIFFIAVVLVGSLGYPTVSFGLHFQEGVLTAELRECRRRCNSFSKRTLAIFVDLQNFEHTFWKYEWWRMTT